MGVTDALKIEKSTNRKYRGDENLAIFIFFNYELPKCNFAESLFCQKKKMPKVMTVSSNYRNFTMPKDIFPNGCSAERHF